MKRLLRKLKLLSYSEKEFQITEEISLPKDDPPNEVKFLWLLKNMLMSFDDSPFRRVVMEVHSLFGLICCQRGLRLACFVLLLFVQIDTVKADSVVVFNEVMYHPANKADDTLEWLELHNQMSYNVDLTGWEITGGIDYKFTNGMIINAGGYLIISKNPTALQAATGYEGALGPFSGNLSNSGEDIILSNNSRRVMDTLDYGDDGTWPVASDGSGVTLAKIDRQSATGYPENWMAETLVGGTPGSSNFTSGQQIQELLTLIGPGSTSKALVPTNDLLETDWTNISFDDSSWASGTAGVGYERAATEDYTPLIGIDVESAMFNKYYSCYARFAFTVDNANEIQSLLMKIKYDDGFVAFLNGQQITFRNAVSDHVWNTPATTGHEATAFEQIDLDSYIGLLQNGSNILAIHGLNLSKGSSDFLVVPELYATISESIGIYDWGLRFNEIHPVSAASFKVELLNSSDNDLDLSGCVLACRGTVQEEYVLPGDILAADGYYTINEADLGFHPTYGDRLFLYSPTGEAVFDAVVVNNKLRGRSPDGSGQWLYPSTETFGSTNSFSFHDDIVINEIMYHSRGNDMAWIELYNRSGQTIDISGWEISKAVGYTFEQGTTMSPDAYMVIAEDADAIKQSYPAVSDSIVGNFSKGLSGKNDRILLSDSAGNPVDSVEYYDAAPWPTSADGYGNSLELRSPWTDNALPEAWCASDEAVNSQWQTLTWRGTANQKFQPNFWNELVIGMLEEGEVLLDDISVIEGPDGVAREFMQNGDFESSSNSWRFCGNHRHSEVIVDEDVPGNHVLRLVAAGATDSYLNHIETTYANNETVVDGWEYQISFRAKWQSGSNQLNARLYFARLAKTVLLEVPMLNGTPGLQNSCHETNIGPSLSDLSHYPIVPSSSESVQISVNAHDIDAVSSCNLRWSVNGGVWNSTAMTDQGDGDYVGTIPAQSDNSIVQFYVEAQDGAAATSAYPPEGPDSRALYKVTNNAPANGQLHNFNLIMTAADVNFMFQPTEVMSNDRLGGTVIYDGKEIYYGVKVRLKSSPAGRPSARVGVNIRFNADKLFRGVHRSVAVDRSGNSPVSGWQDEIYVKHMFNHAGVPCMYDDLIYFEAFNAPNIGDMSKTAILQMARYGSVFIESQWPGDKDGTVFEFDTIYYPRQTVDGNRESLKITNGTGFAQSDFTDLGDDKEVYRWTWLIENNRRNDDYTGIIKLCKTMGPTIPSEADLRQVMDVDEWMRCFALNRLCGIADTYMDNLNHNLAIYVPADGGPVIALPWDMDFVFYRAYNSALWNTGFQLGRIINQVPGNKRLYYGHLRDLVTHTFNTSYMNYWLSHYSSILPGQDFTGQSWYIQNRGQYALSQLPTPAVPFAITDSDMTVDDSTAVVNGKAWIDVHEVYIDGRNDPLELSWTSTGTGLNQKFFWHVTVPVDPGVNNLIFNAYGFKGELLATDTITVTSTVTERPLREHLRITELMYDPAGGSDYEFIELYNTGSVTLDLSHVVFTDGVSFAFSESGFTAIKPGQYILIVNDNTSFSSRYDTTAMNIAGQYSGKLSNSGEKVRIQGQWNSEILSFTYSDSRSWPTAADGAGHSLVPKPEYLDGVSNGSLDYGGNWNSGFWINGSPGFSEPPTSVTVVINEFSAHTDYDNPTSPDHDSNDWIELYNTTGSTITLLAGQWFLSDNKAILNKWAIPQTQIPANGHVSFDEISGFHNPITQGFGLNKAGEQIYLSYMPGTNQDRVVDSIRFKGQANDRSLGRYPDGGRYWFNLQPTRNGANVEPQTEIIITEIMYNPLTGQQEFIELFNNTDSPVELFDDETSTGWRLDGGISFSFEQGTIIGAGEYLIVGKFDPNTVNLQAFENNYGLSKCPVVGPFAGDLSNVTERVALERPQAPDDIIANISWIIIDESIYFDQSPWDSAADGSGLSLQRIKADQSGNDPANFKTSKATLGSEWLPIADFNADGVVNIIDAAVLGSSWLAQEGEENWNPACNISLPSDSVIDLKDLQSFLESWVWESDF